MPFLERILCSVLKVSLFKLHKNIEVAIRVSRYSIDNESFDAPLPPTSGEPNISIGPIDADISTPQSKDSIFISSKSQVFAHCIHPSWTHAF